MNLTGIRFLLQNAIPITPWNPQKEPPHSKDIYASFILNMASDAVPVEGETKHAYFMKQALLMVKAIESQLL